MIEASELRIGNYIKAGGKIICVDVPDIAKCKARPNLRRGIPLTPELLEKCGFETGQTFTSNKGYLTEYDFVSGNTCLTFYDGKIILSQSDEDYENNIIKLPAPKFLHQLQNVWPFLTGEELTINL